MGIRQRISLGFISLAVLLFFAGAVSFSELNLLRQRTAELMEASTRTTDQAKRMLSALQVQNRSIIEMVATNSNRPNASYEKGILEFNATLLEATGNITDRNDLDSIYTANDYYHDIIAAHLDDASSDPDWFINNYISAYYRLDSAIKEYMTEPRSALSSRALLFEKNAYRTITPSILTLCIAIIIVLIFFFLNDFYFVRPIISMNKNLTRYIEHRIPFELEIPGSKTNELNKLKQNIDKLISPPHNGEPKQPINQRK